MTGNALAQVVTVLCAPVLTRLYSPEAFGALALFVAAVAMVAPGVGGRYEIAAIVVSDRDTKRSLFWLAMWFSLAASVVAYICVAIGQRVNFGYTGLSTLGSWVWMLPAAVFFTGAIANLRAWANAENEYISLSRSIMLQAVVSSAVGIILGLSGFIHHGLLIATNVGLFLTAAMLFARYNALGSNRLWALDSKKISIAKKYRDYPLFNAPTSMLNALMTGIPVFYVAKYFPAEIVGYYALLIRVGAAPLSFLADAISRVNLKTISEIVNEQQNPLRYLKSITWVLSVIAVVPTVILVSSGPSIFSFIFGNDWREAGVLLSILMPALAVQFVVSTLSLSIIAAGRLRLLAMWQIFSLVVTVLIFSALPENVSTREFFKIYMIKDIFLYIVYFLVLIYALRHPVRAAEAKL